MRTQVSMKSYRDILIVANEIIQKHPNIDTLEAYDALFIIICSHMDRLLATMTIPDFILGSLIQEVKISIEEDNENYYYRIVTPIGDSGDSVFCKTPVIREDGYIVWQSELVGVHGPPSTSVVH